MIKTILGITAIIAVATVATVIVAQELMVFKKLVCTEVWVGGLPGGNPVQWQWLDGKKITDTFWLQAAPHVKSDHRVRIGRTGLSINSDTATQEGFIIEWNR